MNNKAVILLSGGLDSVVSLALLKDKYDISLALFFNYGQKALNNELKAAEKVAQYYSIPLEIVKLPWLSEISTSSLNGNDSIPEFNINELDNNDITKKTAGSVWVPNRNALFVNIAATYAEAFDLSYVIIGANSEEALTFKDNSVAFINAINNSLKNSTDNNVSLLAPLIEFDKQEIVNKAISLKIPFEYIFSCYQNKKNHCGMCESCLRLKRALQLNNRYDLISKIFEG